MDQIENEVVSVEWRDSYARMANSAFNPIW
jgi:hypothetical protein